MLDLGSGSGRDAYVAAALVGSRGSVVGLDFSRQQLDVARAHVGAWTAELGYSQPNLRFVEGRLEDLAGAGVAPASVDLVLSNCVVNLSPDKRAVLQGVWDALAEGGEARGARAARGPRQNNPVPPLLASLSPSVPRPSQFHFSDVYCDRRLPASARADPLLLGTPFSHSPPHKNPFPLFSLHHTMHTPQASASAARCTCRTSCASRCPWASPTPGSSPPPPCRCAMIASSPPSARRHSAA